MFQGSASEEHLNVSKKGRDDSAVTALLFLKKGALRRLWSLRACYLLLFSAILFLKKNKFGHHLNTLQFSDPLLH